MNKLVSIIVPCYNQVQYLPEALQSVLDQTYSDWECIIVNDGSPDDTDIVAKEWLIKDPRFKYIYKENGGLSSARNAGIESSKGDYIQFLDADDLIESYKIKYQIQFMLNNPIIDISISGYRYFESNSSILKILGRNGFKPEVILTRYDIDIKEVLSCGNPMVISAPIYKKEVFNLVGFFDISLAALEDWDFHFRCALHNLVFEHIGYANKTKTLIRIHPESMTSNAEKTRNQVALFQKHIQKNKLYVNYFDVRMEDKSIRKRNKREKMTDLIVAFIPPVFVKIYRYVKSN